MSSTRIEPLCPAVGQGQGRGQRPGCYALILKILQHPLVQNLRRRGSLRLLQRLHRITHRMPIQLRALQPGRVLVVAPHMDDEVMGPGGSLALHAQLGSSVRVVFCAAGANAAEDHVRRGETQTVKQYLGLAQIEFLGFPEGRLSLHEKQLSQALTSSIQEFSPDQVFCPYFADHHRDHSAATLALCASLEQTAWRGEVWSYEVWSPLWPNVAVDISSVADTKREAIELYASQVQGLHYPEGILGLNRYRGLRVYANYAEAFFVASAAEFIPLAREMNQL